MYKVLTSWASKVRSAQGFDVSGKLNPMFQTKTALCKALKTSNPINQSSSTWSQGIDVASTGYIMQTLEASYKNNFLKVFSGFVKPKGTTSVKNAKNVFRDKKRWYNKPGDIESLSTQCSFIVFPKTKGNSMVR